MSLCRAIAVSAAGVAIPFGMAAHEPCQSGRRAIIRYGTSGLPLPAQMYEQWKDIEMVFDPQTMRIR